MPYEVRTPVFEGDLELLAQLVTRAELDVFTVALQAIVEGYLAETAAAGEAPDLDLATDFLGWISVLVEHKSKMLLVEEDEPEPDELVPPEDRDLLLAHLLEGRTFAEAAVALRDMMRRAALSAPRRAVPPTEPVASVEIDPLGSVDADGLRAALWRALAPRPVVDLYHVTPIRASVSDAIDRVVGALTRCEQLSFFDLTFDEPDRLEVIVRFLAVLELYKRGVVEITQISAFGDLLVRSRPIDESEIADFGEGL
ncbi:MAG: segregation and condensation protein A [Acidimicrobiia bacterium]